MRNPISILVVDDDPALVSASRALLSRRGCRVEAVFSGLDAVTRVRAGGIDAVLMDVWMPEVDGLSALEELARLPNPPRVVLMSGRIDARVEQAVTEGRALACLTKPVDFDLALTLLADQAPERPLSIKTSQDRAAAAAFASQAVAHGEAFLEGAPQLPAGTPVAVSLATLSGELTLLGVADPQSPRPGGKRGLGVRLSELSAAQVRALRTLASAPPEPPPAPREEPADRAREAYRRGLEKLETGKYDRALVDLRAARELNPTDPLMAAAALRAEELAGQERARRLYQDAQKVADSDPAEALRRLEDAIRLDPTRAAYHREAARLYLGQGDAMQLAEERLATAVHLAPSDPTPRLHLAQLLERVGRPQEALWACEAARGLFPGDPELARLAARLERKLQPREE